MLHIRRAEIPIFSIVPSNALGKSELRLAWAALLKVAVVAKGCTFSALLITCINPTRCVGLLTALGFQPADGVCYSWQFVHTLVGRGAVRVIPMSHAVRLGLGQLTWKACRRPAVVATVHTIYFFDDIDHSSTTVAMARTTPENYFSAPTMLSLHALHWNYSDVAFYITGRGFFLVLLLCFCNEFSIVNTN